MFSDGLRLSVLLPAQDNQCRVDRVEWQQGSARGSIRLDDNRLRLNDGHDWWSDSASVFSSRQEDFAGLGRDCDARVETTPSALPNETACALTMSQDRVWGRLVKPATSWEVAFGAVIIGLGIARLLDHHDALANPASAVRPAIPAETKPDHHERSDVVDWSPGWVAQDGADYGSAIGAPDDDGHNASDVATDEVAALDAAVMGTTGKGDGLQSRPAREDLEPSGVPATIDIQDAETSGPKLGREIEGTDGDDHLVGGDGDDVILGRDGNDLLDGGAGDDILDGGRGTDSMLGGAGNDLLDGGAGGDTMAGGTGDDTYFVDDTGDQVVEEANEGMDTVKTVLSEYRLGDRVENLTYVGSNDFTAYGNSGSNVLSGGDGDDLLFGDADDDRQASDEKDLENDAGQKQLEAVQRSDISEQLASAALTELLGSSPDVIHLASAASFASGQLAGAIVVSPDAVIEGSRKNDELVGLRRGNDLIDGGQGNDRLEGGGGDDTLIGGSGNDVFVFRLGFGHDVVTDFDSAGGDHDVILLARELFEDHADLLGHIEQSGGDVLILVSATDHITLQNFDMMNLSVIDQFVFF